MTARAAALGRAGAPLRAAAVVAIVVLTVGAPAACRPERGIIINVYAAPENSFQRVVDACTARAGGRYRIVYNTLPRGADAQRQQLVRRLAARDDAMDVLGLDVTWGPEFAEAGWIVPWTGRNAAAAARGVLAAPLATARWEGRLYAAPKNTNVQLLWYDRQLTPRPPATWGEMITMSQRLKRAGAPHRILFTGAQYEGLVVLYNSLVASAEGRILSEEGDSVVMDSGAVAALGVLRTVATAGVTDPSLTAQREDDIRRAFQRGEGAFQINWPFVYAAYARDRPRTLPRLGWARLPAVYAGGPSRATIGGANLAVSAYSRHKPQAFEAALCLRSARSQKLSAVLDGVPPTIASVYSDSTPLDPAQPVDARTNPSMATAYPMADTILAALRSAAVRPLTPAYQNLSTVVAKVLSPPARIVPRVTAQRLRERLADALASKGVLP